MKKSNYKLSALYLVVSLLLAQACVDAEDLVTPKVASPVLVLLSGNVFSATAPVTVSSTFLKLDKTHILDHTRGIDSIPVSNLTISVMVDNTSEISSLKTNNLGKAQFAASWAELGLQDASAGDQVRLEFVGEYKNIPFRKYHTVRVN